MPPALKLKAVDNAAEDADLPLDLCQYEICGSRDPSIHELIKLIPRETQFTESVYNTAIWLADEAFVMMSIDEEIDEELESASFRHHYSLTYDWNDESIVWSLRAVTIQDSGSALVREIAKSPRAFESWYIADNFPFSSASFHKLLSSLSNSHRSVQKITLSDVRNINYVDVFVRAPFESEVKKLELQSLSSNVVRVMKQSRVQKKASSVALEANAINGECESFLHHCMVSWKSLKSLSIPSISPMLHNTLDKNSKIKAIYLSWCSLLDTRSFLQRADACAKLRKLDIDLDYPPQDRIDEIDLALLAQAFLRANPQVVKGSLKIRGTCLFKDTLVERSITKAAHAVSSIGKGIIPQALVRFPYKECAFEFVRRTLVDALDQGDDL